MPNARMSLCTKLVHSFSFPPRALRTAPSRFPNQRYLNALAPSYLKGTVVRDHPVVWSLALRPDDAKQDPVAYGTKFGVVFLAEGLRTTSIQKGFDCFGLYHPGLEREHDFRLAVELP